MEQNTVIRGCSNAWPSLNFEDWKDTLKSLHYWSQILGKVRLKAMPWQNHSWHTTLLITSRGFTTGSMPYMNGIFELQLDFQSDELIVSSSFADEIKIDLQPLSVSSFYARLFEALNSLGIEIAIHARPNEMADNPLFSDIHHSGYDPKAVKEYWQAAVSIHNVFQEFRSSFIGKCSPVHLFFGAFDIAVTRFSGRPAPLHPGGMPNIPLEVMQEAYSQEVSSAGFWPGSDDFPQPIFYSYCYPTPEGFKNSRVLPEATFWSDDLGEFILKYDDVISTTDPAKTLMAFLESTYEAAANSGNWDRENLEVQ